MKPSDVLPVGRYVAEIAAAATRLVEVLYGIPLDVHVPTCPSWVVRDLVVHQGGIHRWASRIVTERRTERAFMDLDDLGGPPPDAELYRWFEEGASRLAASLNEAPDDLECFTFIEAPTSKLFWARRQAHETAIHRVDGEVVAGARTGFEARFSADGLDELVVGFWKRPGRGPRAGTATAVSFDPVDAPESWTVRFDSQNYEVVRESAEADATVTGTASDLYAWAWGRPAIGHVAIDGDPTAVGRLLGDG